MFDLLFISDYMQKVGMDGRFPSDKYLPFSPDNGDNRLYVGGHGWDDMSPSPGEYLEGKFPNMRTVFMARGPSFRCAEEF